ncbi:MAG: hypothetical protein DCC67_15560 [Planctomycetota bacterium]|nr:MAG: hypothetical protein DCC67_15560 [Planctomycetota bacterium]
MKRFSLATLGVALIGVATAAPAVQAAKIYGIAEVAGAQRLVTWDSANPGTILSDVPITNLPPGETIRGIDFAAPFGQWNLYAIGAGSDEFANVYFLGFNSTTAGVLKLPGSAAPPADAAGETYGVTSSVGYSLRSVDDFGHWSGYSTSSNSGAVSGGLEYAQSDPNRGQLPRLVHLFNDFAVDTALDILATLIPGSGNPLQVSTIGSLGGDFDDPGAMDAATEFNTDVIYAALLLAGQTHSNFYILSQQTGAATLIGPVGNGLLITAMAVEPPRPRVPQPTTAILHLTASVGYLLYHPGRFRNARI